MPLPWPSSSQRQVWLLAGSRLPESRWISFACASLAPARSAGYIDARHRGLLAACTREVQLFTDITKPTEVSFGEVSNRRGLAGPWDSDADHPAPLSPALHRGGHAQEGAHHSSADRKASNMQAHRQHPSILLARQLFPGFQDDQKEVCGLAGCGMSKHRVGKMTTPRGTACHPDLTTPCQPARNPNLDDLDDC